MTDNPYAAPFAAGGRIPQENPRKQLPGLHVLGEAISRALIAAVCVGWPATLVYGLLSTKGLFRSDDPYLIGLFFAACAAGYCPADFLLGKLPWPKWSHNLASSAIVLGWCALWIYVDHHAKEGQGIGTIIAVASLFSAAAGLLGSRVRLRRWFLPTAIFAAGLFAAGLTIAVV